MSPVIENETNPRKDSILIIEDENDLRELLMDVLEMEHFTVYSAANCKNGIEMAKTLLPDFILMDDFLPGMSGFDACRILKHDPVTQDIPIIGMGAWGMSDKKFHMAGACAFIMKPFEITHLFEAIQKVLSSSPKPKSKCLGQTDDTPEQPVQDALKENKIPDSDDQCNDFDATLPAIDNTTPEPENSRPNPDQKSLRQLCIERNLIVPDNLKKMSIVISDDTEDYLGLMSQILLNFGFRYVFFENDAFKTVELVQEIEPDLLITDMMKPGMDGFEMVRSIFSKNLRKKPKVIVASGYSIDNLPSKFKNAGLSAVFVQKPFGLEELFKIVIGVLSSEEITLPDKAAMPQHVEQESMSLEECTAQFIANRLSKVTKSKAKILVIDDHSGTRESVRSLLESDQYEVYTAENRTKGVDEAHKSIPDLILIDECLINFSLIEKLRSISCKQLHKIPRIVLFVGFDVQPFSKILLSEKIINAIIRKPFTKQELIKTVSEALYSPAFRSTKRQKAHCERTELNPRYTFENFIVGSSNRLCHAAAMAAAEAPGRAYNPLFIYGGTGLGKTHIMQAIGHHIQAQPRNFNVKYITTDDLVSEIVTSINANRLDKVRNRLKRTDVLLLDDIQYLQGKERTQHEFFQIFNELYEARKQIVITCSCLPKDIPILTDRLKSRLGLGLIADINTPDYETRLAILQKKLQPGHMTLSDSVLDLIASSVRTNIRDIESIVNRIMAYGHLNGQQIPLEYVEKIIKDIVPPETRVLMTPDHIIAVVANYYNVSVADIKSLSRKKETSHARNVSMYLIREHTDMTLQAIGNVFGKDHASVLKSCDKIKKDSDWDSELRRTMETLRDKLDNP